LLKLTMGQSFRPEILARGQALRQQPVDIVVAVAKVAEDDVGHGMIAGLPWIEADRGQHAVAPCVRNEEARDRAYAVAYPLIGVLHRRRAEQEHRRLGYDLRAGDPVAGIGWATKTGIRCTAGRRRERIRAGLGARVRTGRPDSVGDLGCGPERCGEPPG
jgi:hypothetical protein